MLVLIKVCRRFGLRFFLLFHDSTEVSHHYSIIPIGRSLGYPRTPRDRLGH